MLQVTVTSELTASTPEPLYRLNVATGSYEPIATMPLTKSATVAQPTDVVATDETGVEWRLAPVYGADAAAAAAERPKRDWLAAAVTELQAALGGPPGQFDRPRFVAALRSLVDAGNSILGPAATAQGLIEKVASIDTDATRFVIALAREIAAGAARPSKQSAARLVATVDALNGG